MLSVGRQFAVYSAEYMFGIKINHIYMIHNQLTVF